MLLKLDDVLDAARVPEICGVLGSARFPEVGEGSNGEIRNNLTAEGGDNL